MSALDFFTDPVTGAAIDNGGYSDTQDRLEVDPFAWLDNPLIDTALCSGFGQYHTDHPDAKITRKPYIGLSFAEIKQMMTAPKKVDKAVGQWVIFSSYKNEYGRDVKQQRQHGQYYALWADIDESEGVTCSSIFSLTVEVTGGAETWVYTSRSATEENQKARIILPLSSAVTGADFELLQEAFNNRLAAAGLIPDRVNESCNQVCYLPNRGEFYEYHITDPDEHQPLDVQLWAADIAALKTEREREHSEAIERQARSKARMIELRKGQDFLPRSAANDAYDSKTLWITYGGKVRSGGRVLSPNSSTGAAGITFANDGSNKWFSKHGSDMALGIGQLSKDGASCFGDAFDLICFFDYGNDEKKAAAALSKELDPVANKQRQVDHAIAEQEAKTLELLERQAETLNTKQASRIDLTNPHGIVGDICELMSLKSRRDIPELYPPAALQLVSLVGHKRKSVLTNRFSILSLTIAESAVGKDNPQGTLGSVAKELGVSKHIMGGIGSFKEMITNMIDGDGVTVYSSDEVHSIFQSIANKNAASYEQKIEAEILKMSTNERYFFRGMEKRENLARLNKKLEDDDKNVAITTEALAAAEAGGDPTAIARAGDAHRKSINIIAKTRRHIDYITNGWPFPYFGFMGYSTPKNMESITANPDNIASGMLGRMLINRIGNYIPKVKRELDEGQILFKQACVEEKLEDIQRLKDEPLGITAEARELLDKYADFYEDDEQRLHNTMGAVWRRAYEQVVKVATVMALGRTHISVEDVEYANAYVLSSICDLEHIIIQVAANANGASAETVLRGARNTVLKDCRGAKGLTKYEITKFITRNEQWQAMQAATPAVDRVQELIDDLIKRGGLEEVKAPRSIRYRTVKPK